MSNQLSDQEKEAIRKLIIYAEEISKACLWFGKELNSMIEIFSEALDTCEKTKQQKQPYQSPKD